MAKKFCPHCREELRRVDWNRQCYLYTCHNLNCLRYRQPAGLELKKPVLEDEPQPEVKTKVKAKHRRRQGQAFAPVPLAVLGDTPLVIAERRQKDG